MLVEMAPGNFRSDMARAGAAMFFRPRVDTRNWQREIEAQFSAFAATGLQLDHGNTRPAFPSSSQTSPR